MAADRPATIFPILAIGKNIPKKYLAFLANPSILGEAIEGVGRNRMRPRGWVTT